MRALMPVALGRAQARVSVAQAVQDAGIRASVALPLVDGFDPDQSDALRADADGSLDGLEDAGQTASHAECGHSGTTLSAGESHLSADPGFSPPGSDSGFPAGREVPTTCSTWRTWLRRAHSAEVRLSEALLASLSPVTRVPPLGRQSLMRWSGRSSSLAALEATRWTQSGAPGRVRCELRRGLRRELRRQWSKVTAARRTWCSAACRLPARRWPRTPPCPSPVLQRRPPRARLAIADDLRVACAPRHRSSEQLRAGRSPRRRRCRRRPAAPGRARRTGSSPAPAAGRRGSRQYG
jgi:hypothetical protein